ncbi:MAG: ATP-binding protein [Clostridia bacterium]|nr:ATP-binding protein [Clostridia bacterium]MDD4680795.1 ATP-binding protein [Clostridia bacterium]
MMETRMLIVEDDYFLQDGLSQLLRDEKYCVDCAGTCHEAKVFMEKNDYHLIILDITLPDGNGLDLCAAWRNAGKNTGKSFNISGNAFLRCDSDWLGEAFLNVLKNSCEHTQDDGKILVFIESSEASVTVTIEDNGGGIPKEQLRGLFHRFSRSYRAASKGGAGIGLAITKTIVEKHHGTIYAENTAEG